VSAAKEITPRAKARRKRKAVVQDEVMPNGAMSREVVAGPSCAGLTRASIFFCKKVFAKFDGLPGQARQ
jgi:hypothetical protein